MSPKCLVIPSLALILLLVVPNLTLNASPNPSDKLLVGWEPLKVFGSASNIVAVRAGSFHQIALKDDGTVTSWADSMFSPGVPAGLSGVTAISARGSLNLALRTNGTVVAWGANDSGQTNVPPGLSGITAVSAGFTHGLALRSNGTVVAWGSGSTLNLTNVPAGLSNVIAIAAAGFHSLALKADGTISTWGNPGNELLDVPLDVTNVVAIDAGSNFSLALKDDGTVRAWGQGGNGQTNVPAGLSNVIAIAAGNTHALALTRDGSVVGWGRAVPAGLSNCIAIAAGGRGLAICDIVPVLSENPTNLTVYTGTDATFRVQAVGTLPLQFQWRKDGLDLVGETGVSLTLTNVSFSDAGIYSVAVGNPVGTTFSSNASLVVTQGPPVILTHPAPKVAFIRENFALQTLANGSAPLDYQWQFNGIDIEGANERELLVQGIRRHQAGNYSLRVSNAFGVVITSNAPVTVVPVAVWGTESFGQTKVPSSITNPVAISCGNNHLLCLNADGNLTGWGDNQFGQSQGPPGLTNIVAFASGFDCSFGLSDDGTLRSWGQATAAITQVPPGLSNLVSIANGQTFGIGLKSDGTVSVWGSVQNIPVGVSNVVAISAGRDHGMLLRNDGTVVGVGFGAWLQGLVPAGLSNVAAIACGQFHNVALQRSGKIVAWGRNDFGATNVPPDLTNVSAVAAGYLQSMALKPDRTVVVWGLNGADGTNVPSGLTNVTMIAGGRNFTAALVSEDDSVTETPVNLRASTWTSNTFATSVQTRRGSTYILEQLDMTAPNQATLRASTPGNGRVKSLSDPSATSSQGIYRIRK